MLHVRCGDDIRQNLVEAGIPGTFKRWIEPALDGPPPDICSHEEVVLWFEHDLFDQAILIRLLACYAEQDLSHTTLYLVSRDSYPGVKRFIGFGNLNAAQILDCFQQRLPVTSAQLQLARRVWRAYNDPNPTALEHFLAEETSALPYLKAAMLRYLEDLPSSINGLTRTEQMILESVASGIRSPVDLFLEFQRREEAPWLGDLQFFARLDRLSQGDRPLIRAGALTDLGARVLANEADWIKEADLDAPWRWHPIRKTLVPGTRIFPTDQ